MRSETQPYSTVLQSLIAIRLCRTASTSHREGPGIEVAMATELDFTNAQAFFVSACEQATIRNIKLVN